MPGGVERSPRQTQRESESWDYYFNKNNVCISSTTKHNICWTMRSINQTHKKNTMFEMEYVRVDIL